MLDDDYSVISGYVDGEILAENKFNYSLKMPLPAIFRIQTIPKKQGAFQFKVDFRNSELSSRFINILTITSDKGLPWGITYARFGNGYTTAAKYVIRDGR